MASSYLSPRQSAVVEQNTTSKDMTFTRPINNGSYTFPAENSCKRKFDQSANRVWGGEANLTIYYPKDEKSAVTLYKSFGEIYPNTPSISLSGADEAMFKIVMNMRVLHSLEYYLPERNIMSSNYS